MCSLQMHTNELQLSLLVYISIICPFYGGSIFFLRALVDCFLGGGVPFLATPVFPTSSSIPVWPYQIKTSWFCLPEKWSNLDSRGQVGSFDPGPSFPCYVRPQHDFITGISFLATSAYLPTGGQALIHKRHCTSWWSPATQPLL